MVTEQSRVDRAIEAACTKLGYAGLTLDQEKAVKSFVSGRDVFLHHNIYKWVILCVQVSPFTALKAAFVTCEY